MTSPRRTALVTGVFFLLTIAFSIPGALLYGPLLSDPRYVVGPGVDPQIALGALFELIVGIANVGTAVTLFPLLKRQHEGVALGYVASRIAESTIIAVGIASVLAVVALRQDAAAGGGAAVIAAGQALVALHGATFLLGPGVLAGFGNGLLLGYLMYRSGLVPRPMALFGLVGGPLVAASGIAVLLGLYPQVSVWSAIATVPEFVWEAFLGIYLVVRGFRPAALTAQTQA